MNNKGESNVNIIPIIFLVLITVFGIFVFFSRSDDSTSDGAVVDQQKEQNKPEPLITPFTDPNEAADASDDAVLGENEQQPQNPPQPQPPPQPQEPPSEPNSPGTYSKPPAMSLEDGADYSAVIKTNKGNIIVDLFEEDVPITVNNFVFLADEGYYDGTKSHRIIEDFMIQFGDPLSADDSMRDFWGTGGPGYEFDDEPFEGDYKRGMVAMANSGPNTNGSQFFVVHEDSDLPPNYVIFGIVKDDDSLGAIDQIALTPVEPNKNGEESLPTEDVEIVGINIIKGGTSFGP